MWHVYVLRSLKTGRLYVGMSEKPDERLKAHNGGKVFSTKGYRPWARVYIESQEPQRRLDSVRSILKRVVAEIS